MTIRSEAPGLGPPRSLLRALVCVGVAVVAGLGLWLPSPARAASVTAGWWTRSIAPPVVPAGGLFLQQDSVSGSQNPAAFGAVRFTVPVGAPGLLSLALVDGFVVPPGGLVAIAACPTTKTWTPANGGGAAAAPTYDCSTSTSGTIGTSLVTFELPARLAPNGTFDVVIVPDPSGQPLTYALAFKPPTAEAGTVGVGEIPPDETTTTAFAEIDTPDDPVAVPDDVGSGGGSSFSPAAPVTDPSPTTTATTSAASGDERATGTTPFRPASTTSDDGRGERVLAFVALLGLLGSWFWLGGRPTRAPSLVGTLGGRDADQPVSTSASTRTAPVRGIGRFARPHTAAPVDDPPPYG